MRPLLILTPLLSLLSACGWGCTFPLLHLSDTGDTGAPEPSLELSSAGTFQPYCAPDDGSAILARIGLFDPECGPQPEVAFLELSWWDGVEEAEGLRVNLDPRLFEGKGAYHPEAGEALQVISGWILVQAEGRGQYEVKLENGLTIADTFDLLPCFEEVPECG